MTQCYIEIRNNSTKSGEQFAGDIMRHLQARQHLGKAVVVCDSPQGFLSVCRKQWLKLSRGVQNQRAATLSADKILKYTHAITHMQHMLFTSKSPLLQPDADIYFLHPDELAILPPHCWTVYVATTLTDDRVATISHQLPPDSLVVDFTNGDPWLAVGMQPKGKLEARVRSEWKQVLQFLESRSIQVASLMDGDLRDVEAMDDALDTLLGTSHTFIQIANEFQRALELARPMRISKELRTEFDSVLLLAHRVQALGPGAFSQHFLEVYSEDDARPMYDTTITLLALMQGETLSNAFYRHTAAGRTRLATALLRAQSYLAQSEQVESIAGIFVENHALLIT